MEALLVSCFRAIRSLFTPGMLGVFVLSILLTVAVLFGFVIIGSTFFSWLGAHLQGYALAQWVPWIGGLGSAMLVWLLFPGIMPVVVSFFDNRIADLIETSDYPMAGKAHDPAFWPEFFHDVRFAVVAVLLNILVLPLYLFPLLIPFVFYGMNGYLLGREFFIMVAKRHVTLPEAEALRRRYGRSIMIAGVLLTFLATIPLLNLFAPFWGIAVMVHLYQQFTANPVT